MSAVLVDDLFAEPSGGVEPPVGWDHLWRMNDASGGAVPDSAGSTNLGYTEVGTTVSADGIQYTTNSAYIGLLNLPQTPSPFVVDFRDDSDPYTHFLSLQIFSCGYIGGTNWGRIWCANHFNARAIDQWWNNSVGDLIVNTAYGGSGAETETGLGSVMPAKYDWIFRRNPDTETLITVLRNGSDVPILSKSYPVEAGTSIPGTDTTCFLYGQRAYGALDRGSDLRVEWAGIKHEMMTEQDAIDLILEGRP